MSFKIIKDQPAGPHRQVRLLKEDDGAVAVADALIRGDKRVEIALHYVGRSTRDVFLYQHDIDNIDEIREVLKSNE